MRLIMTIAAFVALGSICTGCGGAASIAPSPVAPSAEPTGALTSDEARYVNDVRDDALSTEPVYDTTGAIVDGLPNPSQSVRTDADVELATLDALKEAWETREVPSQRLSGVRGYWLQLLQHTRAALVKTMAVIDTLSGSTMDEATAQFDLMGRDTKRLLDEIHRLEAL